MVCCTVSLPAVSFPTTMSGAACKPMEISRISAHMGRQHFLAPCEQANTAIDSSLEQLRRLVADNPGQVQRVNKLEPTSSVSRTG
jgi:hypothetical protein